MKKYDIAVVGGGFAGVGAAIAAARQGAHVIIIEKGNSFGGAAANGLVLPFMKYYTKKEDGSTLLLSRGIFEEISNELDRCGAQANRRFSDEVLKLILNRMITESGAEILFHAKLFDAVTENGNVVSLRLATADGVTEIAADCFIDATGDAMLSYLAGCPYHLGREEDSLCQPMTLCFRVGNIDVEKFNETRTYFQKKYKELQAEGKIKNPRENILIFSTTEPNVLHFNTTRIVKKNPVDPFDVTKAELEAREQVFEIFEFLKEHAGGMENSYIAGTASQIGVRESRMIDGEYAVTGDDLVACVKFDDAIAAGNYDIDIHNPEGSGTSHYYFPDGQYYTLPYRSLIPKNINNMLVAGRCISSDHRAQASYRIMPIVCNLGEAAGIAAALACKDKVGVRDIDISRLQSEIVKNGGFIGK